VADVPHAMVGVFLCLAVVLAVALVLIPFPTGPTATHASRIDKRVPTTLGWRSWVWDETNRVLLSPTRRTAWLDPELHCEDWDTSEAIRGVTGIHAHLVPENWAKAASEYGRGRLTTLAQATAVSAGSTGHSSLDAPLRGAQSKSCGTATSAGLQNATLRRPANSAVEVFQPTNTRFASPPVVTGIVERFGRYVLGTEGWRAEWVIVRKLCAPTPEIAEALGRVYPDVEIIHGHRQSR
jgi:hypothetical protein